MHEVKVQNQTLFIEPSIEYARAFWLNHFHSCLAIVTGLPKLDPNAYGGWSNAQGSKTEENYAHLLENLDPQMVTGAYQRITAKLAEAEEYVETWLNYQALWEISNSEIFDKLGNDIKLW